MMWDKYVRTIWTQHMNTIIEGECVDPCFVWLRLLKAAQMLPATCTTKPEQLPEAVSAEGNAVQQRPWVPQRCFGTKSALETIAAACWISNSLATMRCPACDRSLSSACFSSTGKISQMSLTRQQSECDPPKPCQPSCINGRLQMLSHSQDHCRCHCVALIRRATHPIA